MQIKDDPSLKWLEKIKGDPNKRNRSKYCRFHRDHGHDTDECFEIVKIISNYNENKDTNNIHVFKDEAGILTLKRS